MELKQEIAFDISDWPEDANIGQNNLCYNMALWDRQCNGMMIPSSIIIRRGQRGVLARQNPTEITSDNQGNKFLIIRRFSISLKIKVLY